MVPMERRTWQPPHQTHPAKAAGRRCGALVIDPEKSRPFLGGGRLLHGADRDLSGVLRFPRPSA